MITPGVAASLTPRTLRARPQRDPEVPRRLHVPHLRLWHLPHLPQVFHRHA